MLRSLITLVAACLVATFGTANVNQPVQKELSFKMSVRSDGTTTVGDKDMKIQANTEVEYSWKREVRTRTLQLGLVSVQASLDGKEIANTRMSRDGLTDVKNNKTIKIDNAPKQLAEMLTESFGTPLCKIETDEDGKEVKRTIVAGPAATSIIEKEIVATTTIFHPWYSTSKDEWQADMELNTASGLVRGKVTYTKVPGGKGGQNVKVSGTITADGIKKMGGLVMKDGKFVIKGEQTYDLDRQEWVAGKLHIDLSSDLSNGTKVIGSVKGEMRVALEFLPEKK